MEFAFKTFILLPAANADCVWQIQNRFNLQNLGLPPKVPFHALIVINVNCKLFKSTSGKALTHTKRLQLHLNVSLSII